LLLQVKFCFVKFSTTNKLYLPSCDEYVSFFHIFLQSITKEKIVKEEKGEGEVGK
jgi:hypothetical protein